MMIDKTHRSRRGDEKATRTQVLLHTDAVAVIDDDIADETRDEDVRLVDESADHPAQVAQRTRSQVYSIRVPVERLEQVRCLAKERGVAPTVMLREWILSQLDAETGAEVASPELTSLVLTQKSSSEYRE